MINRFARNILTDFIIGLHLGGVSWEEYDKIHLSGYFRATDKERRDAGLEIIAAEVWELFDPRNQLLSPEKCIRRLCLFLLSDIENCKKIQEFAGSSSAEFFRSLLHLPPKHVEIDYNWPFAGAEEYQNVKSRLFPLLEHHLQAISAIFPH